MRGFLLLLVVGVAVAALLIALRLRAPAPAVVPLVSPTPDRPWWTYAAASGAGLAGYALGGEPTGNLALSGFNRVGV